MIIALAREEAYRSQFETGISAGGLTAFPGGARWNWESRIFGGAYDGVCRSLRPKYGALNYRRLEAGGAPRFGSAHLRLQAHTLERTTFCYPDSHLEPHDFAVAARMRLIELAEANAANLDCLDNYIEAHVHGRINLREDVEAVVLDPCYLGTTVELAASELPCSVEWHSGFRMSADYIQQCSAYRGLSVARLASKLANDGFVTPLELGAAREAGVEPQLVKKVWHCVARFGGRKTL